MKIKEIIKKYGNSVLFIGVKRPPNDDGKQSITVAGTGFIVSRDGKFLSNYTTYTEIPEQDFKNLYATVYDGTDKLGIHSFKSYPVKFISADRDNNVVLMRIVSDRKFTNICKIDPSGIVDEGEEVMHMGYAMGIHLLTMGFGVTCSSSTCIVSSVKRRGKDHSLHLFILDTHAYDGSSGSPLFSIETGMVIGLISRKISVQVKSMDDTKIEVPLNMGIAQPAIYGLKLLKDSENKQ